MSPLARSTYLSLFTTAVVFLAYGWWVFQIAGVSYFTGPDALVRIGQSIGILIVAGFAFEYAVQFIGLAIDAKLNGRKLSELVVDERDKLIVYRSIFISMHVLCGGLFLAIGALALGWEPFWVFNIMVLFYAMANATELGAKVYFFRRGIRA